LRRFHEAAQRGDKEVIAWGSGKPMREFLHVDDMAAASIHVMELDKTLYDANTEQMLSHINVGTGVDCTIRELVETVAKVTGFSGEIVWDSSKPDGAPRKLMNVDRLAALGWKYQYSLEEGLSHAFQWFLDNQDNFRG
jgi:GDP-L-fucose synthase